MKITGNIQNIDNVIKLFEVRFCILQPLDCSHIFLHKQTDMLTMAESPATGNNAHLAAVRISCNHMVPRTADPPRYES